MTMPVAALSPPRNTSRAMPWLPCASGKASAYMSDGTRSPNIAMPARASGNAGKAISSRYSGNCQRAVRTSASSRHSTTPTWNWCGIRNIASAPRITNGTNPPAGCVGNACDASGNSFKPNQTKPPSASIASSLNIDSKAIASTSPRLCSAALARRVPNKIANSAIASATYSAPSRHSGGAPLPAAFALTVSVEKLMVIACNCSAMYGISPSTVTSVTVAASQASLPSRVAIRSASEVALLSRASRTSRIMKNTASA